MCPYRMLTHPLHFTTTATLTLMRNLLMQLTLTGGNMKNLDYVKLSNRLLDLTNNIEQSAREIEARIQSILRDAEAIQEIADDIFAKNA